MKMALTVSSDLSVTVNTDENVNKLTDKQDALKKSIQKGEPRSIGISQVMLGFLIISYSVPLLSAKLTEVILYGVPWWSGISFVIAGAVALVMEKQNSISLVFTCMVITVLAAVISVIAVIFYIIDIIKHPQTTCKMSSTHRCDDMYYAMRLSVEVKSILLSLSMVQTAISSAFAFVLYKERQNYNNYLFVN
ncbi:transmembrane protein 176 [Neoarius graeffei]|uniref:transmembrane protein 176 n=1 Tax=Neoarius graeffei TaxID=443677 RepID=UPI00298BE5FC|nr:transmembrane protein 176 [Neoarius graeffei]XP_060780839.1 transmembrane protein 176 [Neoarius graeffei]